MDRKIPLASLGWDLGALSSSTKRVPQGWVRAGNKTCGEQREQMRPEGLEGSVFEAAVPAVVALLFSVCPRTGCSAPIASQGAHERGFGVANPVANPVRSRNFFPFLQKSENLRLLGRRFGDQLGNSSPVPGTATRPAPRVTHRGHPNEIRAVMSLIKGD